MNMEFKQIICNAVPNLRPVLLKRQLMTMESVDEGEIQMIWSKWEPVETETVGLKLYLEYTEETEC